LLYFCIPENHSGERNIRVPQKKIDIIRVNLDALNKTPVIGLEKSADYFLEMMSENIIEHISVASLRGKVIFESVIERNTFVFTYQSGCIDMLLLRIRLRNQPAGLQILVL